MGPLSFQEGWESQPQLRAELAAPYKRAGSYAILGNAPGVGGVGTRGQRGSSAGLGLTTDGAAGSYWNIGKHFTAQAGATSWVVVFQTSATTGQDYVSGTVNTGTSYIEDLMLNGSDSGQVVGAVGIFIRDHGGSTFNSVSANIGINDGRPHCVVFNYTTSSTIQCFVDGVSVSLSGTGSANPTAGTTEFDIWLNTRNVRGTGSAGSDSSQAIQLYARLPMLLRDPASISRNPWQLFEPRLIPVPSASAVSVTGTLARTTANDTSAATGTTTVVGTLAKTTGADTGAASGTTTVTGALAKTTGADTSVASGAVGSGVSGSLVVTTASDTVAASGTTTIAGALAVTTAGDIVVAAGWAGAVTGTLARTTASDTANANGATTMADGLNSGGDDGDSGRYIGSKRHQADIERRNQQIIQITAALVASGVLQ